MRLFLSIAICSLVTVGNSLAGAGLTWSWSGSFRYQHWGRDSVVNFTGNQSPWTESYGSQFWHNLNGFTQYYNPSEFALSVYQTEIEISWTNNEKFTVWLPNSGSNTEPYWNLQTNSSNWFLSRVVNGVTNTLMTNVVMPGSVRPVTNNFDWTFPADWDGVQVEIRSGTNVLSSFVGSGRVVGSVVAPGSTFSNAVVYLDGVSTATIAGFGQSTNWVDNYTDRPAYEFRFDQSYQGGEFKIVRTNGTVAVQAGAGVLDAIVSGRVTLSESSSGEVWTRVPAGDGIGSVWVPTGVIVQGSGVTSYSFYSNPSPTPAPTPTLPSPTPGPSPTAAPSPVPTPGTNSVVVSPSPTPGEDVTVDVEEFEAPDVDDGEEGVLDQATSAGEKIRQILDTSEDIVSNIGLTYNEFHKLAFGGVGTSCDLQFGPVTIHLGGLVPGFVRSGMKLVILLTWAIGCYRVITWTFS